MNNNRIFIAQMLCFICTIGYVFAQNTHMADQPFITVKGSAEMEVIPDEIYIKVLLKEYAVGKVTVTMEEVEAQFIEEMKGIGLPPEAIHLERFSERHIRVRRKKDKLEQTKTFEVMLTEVDQILPMMEALGKIPKSDAQLARVDHAEIARFRAEVKQEAAKAAKRKATLLTEAIGSEIGKPLQIIEVDPTTSYTWQHQDLLSNSYMNKQSYQNDKTGGNYTLKPIKLRYEIMIQFALK